MTDLSLSDYITTAEAGKMLDVGGQRIRDLIRDKRLTAIKVADRWLVLKEDVENFERLKPWERARESKIST